MPSPAETPRRFEAEGFACSVGMIAAATGGTYVKLYPFVDLAFERLGRSLDGHYLLTFEVPVGRIEGPVTVELRKGPYRVHYPPLVLKWGALESEPPRVLMR